MATPSFGRTKSGDRFYNPPARRQIQQEILINQGEKMHDFEYIGNQMFIRRRKPQETVVKAVEKKTVAKSTNFDHFMEYTSPLIPAQYFSKTSMKGHSTWEDEFRPYFELGDLWDSFREWSAYGAGVPLLYYGNESVVQYYAPYLSGIQLYIDPTRTFPETRRPGEESDESSETSSDDGIDYETERELNCFASWRKQELAKSNQRGMKGLSLRVKPLDGSGPQEVLVFQHLEDSSPYSRQPLSDRIAYLATLFPKLKTYRSYELSPSSWLSVAWYPIYRIPGGQTIQNPSASFLTYHSLSTPIKGLRTEWPVHFGSRPSYFPNGSDMDAKLPLPIFALVAYKFKIWMWSPPGVDETQKLASLVKAAGTWISRLQVYHPDHRFFSTNRSR